jgi:ribonucleoside-diphosphate reductase beta chain
MVNRKKSSLIHREGLPSFKPFLYPKAYEFYSVHEQMHWTKDEVNLGKDVQDWNIKLTDKNRKLVTSILRLFTQADTQVGMGYDVLLRIFKPTEIQMMLRSFAARENIHIDAYSDFTDTMGFGEDFYNEFLEYDEMKDKMMYIHKARVRQLNHYLAESDGDEEKAERLFHRDVAKMLAIYGGLTEGTMLFSSFAILMNMSRQGVMPGLKDVLRWSIQDEDAHCQGNSWLFRQFIKEHRHIWDDELKKEIYEAARTIVTLEDAFIDLAFDNGDMEGLTRAEMKEYIRYICDRRLIELSLKPNFGVKVNPLPWMEEILNTGGFANFFERTVTEYGKGATNGNWEDAKSVLNQFRE